MDHDKMNPHSKKKIRSASITEAEKVNALQESEAKFRAYMENAPLGIFVANMEGHYLEVNRTACQMSGYTEEELLNISIPDFLAPEFLEKGMKVFERLLAEGYAEDDVMVRKKNGEVFWINLASVKIDSNRVIAFCQDITKQKKAEGSLIHQLGFEKMIADISSVFASQPSEKLEQSINYALAQIGEFFQIDRSYVFQFSDDGKQISNVYEWCSDETAAQMDRLQNIPLDAFPWWVEQIKNNKYVNIPDVNNLPSEAEAEKKEFKSQDVQSLLSIPMMKNGIVFGCLGLDAVKEKKVWTENDGMLLKIVAELLSNSYTKNLAEEKIRYLSFHDGLTGLYNRAYLKKEMERLDTERQLPIGIIMADLNGFKKVNDTLGHSVGDDMLRQTAEILRSSCRSEDIISRWGGDEFVIFLPQTTEEDVKAICHRIKENCTVSYVKDIPLSLALGYAIKNSTKKDLLEILKEADENMYIDKLADKQQA